jgi:hypothetical protein
VRNNRVCVLKEADISWFEGRVRRPFYNMLGIKQKNKEKGSKKD